MSGRSSAAITCGRRPRQDEVDALEVASATVTGSNVEVR